MGQAVDLDADPRLAPVAGRFGDVANLFDQSLAERERRDQQLAEVRRPAEAGEVVEEIGNVSGDVFISSEDAEILVGLRRGVVVVPRAEMHVAAKGSALAPD